MNEPLFQHVLVPTDGSENSIKAARLAFRVAAASAAAVTLLYVIDAAVLEEIARFSEQQRTEIQQELRQNGLQYLNYLDMLGRDAHLTMQQVIREGEPYQEIVALATELGADLIVMGHVGRRGPRRILIGSVTERVLEFANCPVLVVKDHED